MGKAAYRPRGETTAEAFFIGLALFSATSACASEERGAGFFSDWLNNVTRTQEAQPHWESLLGMASPRLTQGFRYNYARQHLPGGATIENYGMGKGLELVLGENFEAQVGMPAYIESGAPRQSGWSDATLGAKYRFGSANEESGNYVVSGALGMIIPAGPLSSSGTMLVPTLAAGKGWGTRNSGIDAQGSLSASIPERMADGLQIAWHAALQGHPARYMWPEIEANYAYWHNGPRDGKSRLVMTYGIVFGRFEIEGRKKLTFGIGRQETRPDAYGRAWLAMTKLSF